jgi:hypothetical protein
VSVYQYQIEAGSSSNMSERMMVLPAEISDEWEVLPLQL